MIPVRLELKNFLPYRSPDPLYFEGIHLACLTGNNGAGKSSLLDAITFALWGKARSKRDDDMVHIGQMEMYVQLDFEQEGTVYRVLRRRKAGKRGQGALELFTIQADNSLRTINEPSMELTQKKIISILRLDYETFINSAFLQQGKSDAFTSKTPSDRKKILSNILGLDRWADYELSVKGRIAGIEQTIAGIDGALAAINDDLAQEPEYQRGLVKATQEFDIADQARKDAEARLAEVQDAPGNLNNATSQMNQIMISLSRFEQDMQAIQEDIRNRQEAIDEYASYINQGEAIEQGYRNLQEARQASSSLGTRLSEINSIDQRINKLQTQLDRSRAEIESSISAVLASIREIEGRISADAQSQYDALSMEVIRLQQIEAEREQLNATVAALNVESSGLSAQFTTLKDEGQRLNQRIEQLQLADSATCPLCGQPLDASHRDQILTEITAERDHKRTNWTITTKRIKEIEAEVKSLNKQSSDLSSQIATLPAKIAQKGALENELQQSQQAAQRLAEAQIRLEQLQQQLATEDYGHEWRHQLQAVQAERAAIQYDASEHATIQQQVTAYQSFESDHAYLEVARQNLPREQRGLESAHERLKHTKKLIAEDQQEQEKLSQEISRLKLQVSEYERRKAETNTQRTLAAQASERVATARQQLSTLEQQRIRKQDYELRRARSETSLKTYEKLKLAFGKNGIPAMIIESAIPELESATNELLARMTDGKMHMRLVTQREKVDNSGLIETLDIEIADELGTRPYEMYSGGETFRIDFAIRVALSKMLARRAGAHLRTLFIDEGFGTQDEDGRNKLIEAINAIQQDFELILVITHIDELRDAFPVHIMVEKTASGSMIAIR